MMEFTTLIVPLTRNTCRTCLLEFNFSDPAMYMSIQDLIEHEDNKIKLIDILVFLNCLENNDEENWPQHICTTCVSTALLAYTFKLNCLKANETLTQFFTISNTSNNFQRSDVDTIDINVVYQDHEYDVPLFSNNSVLDFEPQIQNKELVPLPPVTDITLTQQVPRKVGEKAYTCSLCSKSFTRIYNLRYHMSKHGDFKRYLCAKCGKDFNTSNGLRQHLKTHSDVPQFKCGFCNKIYKSRQSLREHFRIAHSSHGRSFSCVTCDKKFTTKSTLAMHIKTHSGIKDYACSVCPKRFTRPSYLKAHCLTHTGQEKPRPFKCKHRDCDRAFSTKYSLLVHIAHSHSTERPYKCDACPKGFATSFGLKVHKESHESQPIFCSICDKKLASKRVLQKHMKIHERVDNLLNTDYL
ncbi:gastrula zinc finger protein XlCGF57.1-like [Aricia agestis]|uniref:gastrula zinc finger protein XlCGF57.1-like n=1 Tax=Aricia agestis TaxID=91739 RepID=UPI001C2060AC|nr:gastrula zinc finger protein XlCGF57.1-like [Aricia agestis]